MTDVISADRGLIRQLYIAWLGTDQPCEGYGLFGDDIEELWDLPDGLEIVCEIDDHHTPTFAVGYVIFARYRGHHVVLEQNASPYLVWYAPC